MVSNVHKINLKIKLILTFLQQQIIFLLCKSVRWLILWDRIVSSAKEYFKFFISFLGGVFYRKTE